MTTTRGGLEPAVIVNKDTDETVRCMFNPHEYTLTKQNRWERGKTKGKNVPKLKFSRAARRRSSCSSFSIPMPRAPTCASTPTRSGR